MFLILYNKLDNLPHLLVFIGGGENTEGLQNLLLSTITTATKAIQMYLNK